MKICKGDEVAPEVVVTVLSCGKRLDELLLALADGLLWCSSSLLVAAARNNRAGSSVPPPRDAATLRVPRSMLGLPSEELLAADAAAASSNISPSPISDMLPSIPLAVIS